MENYEKLVWEHYLPILEQYHFQFAKMDEDDFFLIGDKFALNIFIDRMDRRSDVLYVLLGEDGLVRTFSLIDIMLQRFDEFDSEVFGNPH